MSAEAPIILTSQYAGGDETMDLADIVGWAAFLITVTYTCVGLPIQVRKNYLTKSTSGLSLFMMGALFLTFSVWIVYGSVKSPRDWFIIASNIPGAIWAFVMLCQFRIYGRK
ncbi:MAG: SemiSWEET family transporter [Deltaproteobacteria bacterium]